MSTDLVQLLELVQHNHRCAGIIPDQSPEIHQRGGERQLGDDESVLIGVCLQKHTRVVGGKRLHHPHPGDPFQLLLPLSSQGSAGPGAEPKETQGTPTLLGAGLHPTAPSAHHAWALFPAGKSQGLFGSLLSCLCRQGLG